MDLYFVFMVIGVMTVSKFVFDIVDIIERG